VGHPWLFLIRSIAATNLIVLHCGEFICKSGEEFFLKQLSLFQRLGGPASIMVVVF
jgi:hypothetical protein